ncbi:MAG: hypothetical protein R3F59_11005 [Myxococcota bacterium]
MMIWASLALANPPAPDCTAFADRRHLATLCALADPTQRPEMQRALETWDAAAWQQRVTGTAFLELPAASWDLALHEASEAGAEGALLARIVAAAPAGEQVPLLRRAVSLGAPIAFEDAARHALSADPNAVMLAVVVCLSYGSPEALAWVTDHRERELEVRSAIVEAIAVWDHYPRWTLAPAQWEALEDEMLTDFLGTSDESTVRRLFHVLDHAPLSHAALQRLAGAIGDPVRGGYAIAVVADAGVVPDARLIRVLQRHLRDGGPTAEVFAAVHALGPRAAPLAADLHETLEGPNHIIAEHAAEALVAVGPPGTAVLGDVLRSRCRGEIATDLGADRCAAFYDALNDASLDDPSVDELVAACRQSPIPRVPKICKFLADNREYRRAHPD